jgi:hypothetical protein
MELTILLYMRVRARTGCPGIVVTFWKMHSALANPTRPRRSRLSIWSATALRIVLFSIACTGLGMAVGLFTGILVQVVRSLVHRGAIDMTVAYRFFAFPLAITCGLGALVVFAVIETRTARRLLAER